MPVRAPTPCALPLCLSAALEAVHPGVSPGAEAGRPLDPALALPSPPSPALDLAPVPGAAPAPTQDPGASTGGAFLCPSLSAAIVRGQPARCAGHLLTRLVFILMGTELLQVFSGPCRTKQGHQNNLLPLPPHPTPSGPGVDPGHRGAARAPDLDPAPVPQPRGGVVAAAPPLRKASLYSLIRGDLPYYNRSASLAAAPHPLWSVLPPSCQTPG